MPARLLERVHEHVRAAELDAALTLVAEVEQPSQAKSPSALGLRTIDHSNRNRSGRCE